MRANTEAYVYFIQREDGPIKIGVAQNPKKRLAELQTGSNKGLSIVGSFPFKSRGDAFKMEKELHEHFAPFRQEGEWFHKGLLQDIMKNMLRKKDTFRLLRENIRRGRLNKKELVNAGVLAHFPELGITWEQDLINQRQKRLRLKYKQKNGFTIRQKQLADHAKVIEDCKAAGIDTKGLPDHILVKKLKGETV